MKFLCCKDKNINDLVVQSNRSKYSDDSNKTENITVKQIKKNNDVKVN